MNTNSIAARVFSLALAAVLTTATLAGIDSLAQTGHAPDSLLAQIAAMADRPA